MLILLLLGQPLGALAGTLQASFDDASVQGHCETDLMEVQHVADNGVEEEADCGSSCDLCAACAAMFTDTFEAAAGHIPSAINLGRIATLPAGITTLLLRPPILS